MLFATSAILLALCNSALAAVIPRTVSLDTASTTEDIYHDSSSHHSACQLPAAVSLKPIVSSTGEFAGLLDVAGDWTIGAGATYTVVPVGTAKNFYLKTSAGYCDIETSGFTCASSTPVTQYQLVSWYMCT